jgi:hypothetical protein
MCKKSFAEKREILNNIPRGVYCYTWADEDKLIPCPYWKSINEDKAKCTLTGIKDRHRLDSTILLWDQVKICGYKKSF